jgi:hypothetical protein
MEDRALLAGTVIAGMAGLVTREEKARDRYRCVHCLGRSQMKPRISLITLGVDELKESLRFYRDGLGLATQGITGSEFEDGAVAFFDLQANLELALYPHNSLAKDSGLPLGTTGVPASALATTYLRGKKSTRQ